MQPVNREADKAAVTARVLAFMFIFMDPPEIFSYNL